MASILQRVLQTIATYSHWTKNIPTNERTSSSLPQHTQNTPAHMDSVSSYKKDIKSFGELMMTHIQNGTLTQEAVDNVLEERKENAFNNIEHRRQKVVDAIDREIEATYNSLPESQRQRFKENINRQARIDEKLSTPWSALFNSEHREPFSWQTDLIANIVQDPELEKLAQSIRIKEKSNDLMALYTPTMDFYSESMDSYGKSPLGGPLAALRVHQATQSPEKLQAFMTQVIENKRDLVERYSDWYVSKIVLGGGSFPLTPTQQENAYVLEALAKEGYSGKEISGLVCNAVLAAQLPLQDLGNVKSYLTQLSPADSEKIKVHYIQQFAKMYVIGSMQSMDGNAFSQIETFLEEPLFSKMPQPVTMSEWLQPVQEIDMGRLADVLLQTYDVDTVVPMLEAYQGNRALDGSLLAENLVSNVRTYLNERLSTTPTAATLTGATPSTP